MENKKVKLNSVLSIITFFVMNIAILVYYGSSNSIAAILFILLSIFLPVMYCRIYGTYLNSKSIFSLVFFFTVGLSMLRLHHYQVEWKYMTFVILEFSYFSFLLGYDIGKKRIEKQKVNIDYRKIKLVMNTIFYLSVIALIVETMIRGYLPLFSSNMASYQKFSVTGIHYFTVSCVVYLPFSYYVLKNYEIDNKEKIKLIIKSLLTIAIPILIVSRQLLIMEIILTFFIALKFANKKSLLVIIIFLILGIFSWVLIGNFRNQDENYLKSALKIQDDAPLSTANMRLYMYLSFNYDNFNANVDNVERLTYGYESLFPIFALTGTKFLLNDYLDVDHIRVINSFTTYPIQMCAYSDFGLLGVIVYMFFIGLFCKKIELKSDNIFNLIYKSITWYSLAFSFFTSFFSNASIVFLYVYIYILSRISLGSENK